MTESGGAPGARLPETTISVRAYFGRDAKLRHLRLLVAIEDAGQLSKAAALLHITQPALSKALSEIERSIGHPLFDRGPRGLVPNARGAALIRAARNVLGELDRVSVELRDLVDRPGRVLMVGAMPTAGLGFLGRAIALLHQRDPGLTVRVTDGITEALVSQLVVGRLQMVVGARLRESMPQQVQAHWLFDDPMVLVVGVGHPLARRKAPDWAACLQHPWVLPSPGHPLRQAFDAAVRRAGLPPPVHTFEGLEIGLVLALLAQAQALNLMPARLAGQLQAEGRLRVLGGPCAGMIGMHLATTAFVQARPEPEVAALLDCLRRVVSSPD
jgi:DNA-binding transcriptional LysR family regulator